MTDPTVYVLTNELNTVLYVGVTSDLEQRIRQHRAGTYDGFTKRYNLKKLVCLERFPTMERAIAREKQLKSWSRKRKEELILSQNPYWQELMDGEW